MTLFERGELASGASWGDAGYISPVLSVPLPEPSILRYGITALVDPCSPLSVPVRPDPGLYAFLGRFARHCSRRQWHAGMAPYRPLNEAALAAYETLTEGVVDAKVSTTPITAAFRSEAQAATLLGELRLVLAAGQGVEVEILAGAQARGRAAAVGRHCSGRAPVRWYSFPVPTATPPSGPSYFPAQRIACTPYWEGLKVAGLMEFDTAEACPHPRGLASLRSVRTVTASRSQTR